MNSDEKMKLTLCHALIFVVLLIEDGFAFSDLILLVGH